jgi:integral membrane sensor domain MASE1
MKTARQRVWWGIAVAFALGVGLVTFVWVMTSSPSLVIALLFVVGYFIAAYAGIACLAILDELLKECRP